MKTEEEKMERQNQVEAASRGHTVILVSVALLVIVALLLAITLSSDAFGQQGDDPGRPADKALMKEIIDSVTAKLNEFYVFPDVAKDMEKHVRKQLKDGEYDTLATVQAFARAMTEDLREISNDRHLWVDYFPDEFFERMAGDTLTDAGRERRLLEMAFENYGFQKLERLSGNIGYLDLRGFQDAEFGGATAVAAMNFLANSYAIIIDLRQNGGGSPSMIQLISSYFFDEPKHLNSFYIRSEDTIQQFWTQSHVQGKKMVDTPLFILTSQRTFSAAEEFTYNMKNMERATIIGETTGGGAHPVERHPFANLSVAASIPFGRAINPISGTNWEGTGITPHIEVSSDDALMVARKEALGVIIENASDLELKEYLTWDYETLKALIEPATLDEALLKKYAGVYGPRTIIFENGVLYYQREGNPRYKMTAMTQDTFVFEDIEYFRIRVITDDSGNPTELNGLYQGGRMDVSPKSGG